MNLILAINETGAIGYNGRLPWHIKQELQLFSKITHGHILVVGSTTMSTLPLLENREIIVLTNNPYLTPSKVVGLGWKNTPIGIVHSWNEVLKFCNCKEREKEVFVAGGAQIYSSALKIPGMITKIYISIIHGQHQADTYLNNIEKSLTSYVLESHEPKDNFDHYVLSYSPDTIKGERQYLSLAEKILNEGELRSGRNGGTFSLFGEMLKFDLRVGFPLLTTKKMFTRGIIEEFLFFLRGDTDSSILSDKKVKIWEGNTNKDFISKLGLPYAEGIMGPMYGYQWRSFGRPYTLDNEGHPIDIKENEGIDQLKKLVEEIKTNPYSRRLLMTTYNPAQAEEGVLYPCHSIVTQFYVSGDGKYIDMICYNRSQDLFLGVPYNIASSSLLLMIVGKLTDITPRYLTMNMGDVHIYESHTTQMKEQIKRFPYKPPTMDINGNICKITDINNLTTENFTLTNYSYHPTIKAEMVP
jgi:thymidylate synthase